MLGVMYVLIEFASLEVIGLLDKHHNDRIGFILQKRVLFGCVFTVRSVIFSF